MGCDFKPGDEVVCVDAGPRGGLKWCGLLEMGATYTVTGVGLSPVRNHLNGTPVVWIAECSNLMRDGLDIGFDRTRFRKVERRTDRLSIEAFLTIKPGFEEPRRAPAKKRERVQ